MDIKNTQEWAKRREAQYNKNVANTYDWESEGVLQKCLPKILFRGAPVLVTFIQLIDMRVILLLKAIKRIKEFKHISSF